MTAPLLPLRTFCLLSPPIVRLLVAVDVVAVVVVVGGSMFGEAGGAEDEDDEAEDEADDRDDVLVDELVEETFLADSAALLRTMRLIDETEGKLSSSQIPSDCN